MHLLGECLELIHLWAMLAQFWSSSGRKMTENGSICWFPTVISKSIHTIQFKLVVYTCWVCVQNCFAFGPLVAENDRKWVKMLVFDNYQKKVLHNPTCGVHLFGECSELIIFWATLAKFWHFIDHNMTKKILKIVVSNHYLKKYSCNPIQTWSVHLLGECSEFIRFWAMLAKFWPSVGHKMTKNGGFRPLSVKVFMQYNSNLVCTFTVWVFRIDSLLGHVGQILAL